MTNVCPECKAPILEGDPVHGALHIHWACYERAMTAFKADPNAPLELARANGGTVAHWLRVGHNTSLCGHTPQNTPGAHMRPRGYWLRGVTNVRVTCKRCELEKCELGLGN